MIRIRLARFGRKKRSFFRIVVSDARSPRDGRYIENIGFYDPFKPKESSERTKFRDERYCHWVSIGAKPTPVVLRLKKEYDSLCGRPL